MIQTKEDKEVMFTRVVLCELIKQAMDDAAIDENKIVCERNRAIAASWREDAIRFIKTDAFERIVNIFGHEVDPYRKKAYL